MGVLIMVAQVQSVREGVCVGVDLHKDSMTVCVIDRVSGEITYRKLSCKCRRQIAEYFSSLARPSVVAIESVGFYRWLWDLLEPIVDELQLADAARCRAAALSRPKTDREDAFNVADLLAAGQLPTHRPITPKILSFSSAVVLIGMAVVTPDNSPPVNTRCLCREGRSHSA
jgi:hypothetical protein